MHVHIKTATIPGVEELPPDTPIEPGLADLDEIVGVGGSGWVITRVTAVALGVAPRTIRDYIRRGELDARSEGEGVQRTWYVSVDSMHELRTKGTSGKSRRDTGRRTTQVK